MKVYSRYRGCRRGRGGKVSFTSAVVSPVNLPPLHRLVHPLIGIVIFIQQIIYLGFLSRGDHSSMGLGQIS